MIDFTSRNVLRTLLWDLLEVVATRPLALVQDSVLYSYGTDFNKNVTEVFDGTELWRRFMTTRHTDKLLPRETLFSPCSGAAR